MELPPILELDVVTLALGAWLALNAALLLLLALTAFLRRKEPFPALHDG